LPSEFSDFWSLYESSFPVVEKRDLSAQDELYDLIIMSYGRGISQKELDTFKHDFQNVIL